MGSTVHSWRCGFSPRHATMGLNWKCVTRQAMTQMYASGFINMCKSSSSPWIRPSTPRGAALVHLSPWKQQMGKNLPYGTRTAGPVKTNNNNAKPPTTPQQLTRPSAPSCLLPAGEAGAPAQRPTAHNTPCPSDSSPAPHPTRPPSPPWVRQWGTPPPTYGAHNIIKQQSPVLSRAFMRSQHFKKHSTCCMLGAVRLQGWILQCFRKKVGWEESVREGNRPSFVEFFLRVYAWLYKRTFFFLTSKRQYYFTQTYFQEWPSYFYMNQCLVEAEAVKGKPSLHVRNGNSLTSAAKPINTRVMGQWKRN